MSDIADTEIPKSNENTPQSLKPYVEPLREENKKVPNKVMEMIAHFKEYFKTPKLQENATETFKNNLNTKFDSENLDMISEMVQTDESKRMITENIYDCWETVPINSGTVKLRINYPKPMEMVVNTLNGIENDGVKYVASDYVSSYDKRKHFTEVHFEVPLSDLKIPDKFGFGYARNIDGVVKNLEFFESLNVPPEVIKPSLNKLASKSRFYLVDAIQKIKSVDPNAPFPDIPNKILDQEYQRLYAGTLRGYESYILEKKYPQFDPNKPSILIKSLKESVLKYIDEHDNDIFSKIKEYLNEADCGEDRSFETTLDLCPAIYHDTIIDSRFVHDGRLDGGIVAGDIISEFANRDLDASASAVLLDKFRLALSFDKNEVKKLYTPPNMTNMFFFHIPVVTEKMFEADKKLRSENLEIWNANSNFFVNVYLCENLTRLNPMIITEQLNRTHREGGWILATIDSNTNTLKRVNVKPKENWKVTSKKPRINIPWVPVYRESG